MSIRNLYNKLTAKYWFIGFSERKPLTELKFQDIHWVNRAKGEWFADPFILSCDEETITVLVEYVVDPDPLGKIAKFIIDRKTFNIISKQIILDLPTHLSFPAIIRMGGDVYIYPENSASGELNLYKLNPDATSCERVCTLVKAPLTDAIIFERDGEFYMTATEEPGSNGNLLKVFKSDEKFGPYSFVKDILMVDNTARNAGYTLVGDDGTYYKISQENNSSMYGRGMVFYSMSHDFKFKIINKINPEGGFVGVHTMNPYNDLIVWDGKKYEYPILANLVECLVKLIKRFKG